MPFLQKSTCGCRALSVEPPHRRRRDAPTGRQTGGTQRKRNEPRRDARIKSEVNEAGRAKEVRAHPVTFVSTLFEIDDN